MPDYRKENATSIRQTDKARYDQNRAAELEKMKHYRQTEGFRRSMKKYRGANQKKMLERTREWRAANREIVAEGYLKYCRSNPDVLRARNARRRTLKLRATPWWADRKAIKAVYREAVRLERLTGVPHHVDHIIPLKGKNVCGLHVAANLRAIPATENLRKGNKEN